MILRQLAIISLIFFSLKKVNGQATAEHLNTLIKSYINEMNTNGVDTFCIYQDYCVGCDYKWNKAEDKCGYEGLYIPTYIFWLKEGQTFMTKKDNCFDYSIITVENDSLWQFFFSNQDTIVKQEIKMPQYIEVKNGKEQVYSVNIDHSVHEGIQIILRQDTLINKDLNEFYFCKEVEFGQQQNINYEYNIKSPLKEFQLLIARTITTATQQQKLQKSRR